jgi:hypothetical protein
VIIDEAEQVDATCRGADCRIRAQNLLWELQGAAIAPRVSCTAGARCIVEFLGTAVDVDRTMECDSSACHVTGDAAVDLNVDCDNAVCFIASNATRDPDLNCLGGSQCTVEGSGTDLDLEVQDSEATVRLDGLNATITSYGGATVTVEAVDVSVLLDCTDPLDVCSLDCGVDSNCTLRCQGVDVPCDVGDSCECP